MSAALQKLTIVKPNGLEKYARQLTYSEVRWNYVYVDIRFRALFPATGRPFKVRAGDRDLQAVVNEKHRLKISLLKHFVRVDEGRVLIFERIAPEIFRISVAC